MSKLYDLAMLGIEAGQYYQLAQARQEINNLSNVVAIDARNKEILSSMRDFIFKIFQAINDLERDSSTQPARCFLLAKSLQARLNDSGITPEVFSEFSDKEYVQKTYSRIQILVNILQKQLNSDQIHETEMAFKYISESTLLDRAINAITAREKLDETENEWNKLSSAQSNSSSLKTFGILSIIGAFLSPCFIAIGSAGDKSEKLAPIATGVVFVGGLVLGIILLIQSNRTIPARYQELKNLRESWRALLMKPDVWNHVLNLFGDPSSIKYNNIKSARNDFLYNLFEKI